MFTDTHCHLAAEPLASRLPEIMFAAQQAGVSGVIVPATQPSDWQSVLDLQGQAWVRAVAVGVHPWFAGCDDDFVDLLADVLRHHVDAWVGEIGLDALVDVPFERQQWVLAQQLELAHFFQRPVIVHNVRSTAALVAVLKRYDLPRGGIVHAFSGSMEEAKILIKLGFKIGIGSLLLNPKAKKVQRLAAELPLSALVLETDSPYMLPNAVNTPANVVKIAEMVAESRGLSLEALSVLLEENLVTLGV